MDLQSIQNLMGFSDGPAFVLEEERLLLSNPEAEALGLTAGASAKELLKDLPLPASGEAIRERRLFLHGQYWILRVLALDHRLFCQLRPEANFIPPANDNTLLRTAGSIRYAIQDLTTALDELADSAGPQDLAASQPVSLALRSIYRLRRTAGSLEMFVRLRSGSYELKPMLCDVGIKTKELCGELAELLQTAGIQLRQELPAASMHVCLDWELVSLLLRELITNAALRSSDRCITLSLRRIGKDKLCFCVKNRIDGPVTETLFHRYAAENCDLQPGLGMGLSLVSAGAACHHGSLLLSAEDADMLTAILSIGLADSPPVRTNRSNIELPRNQDENLIALSPALPPEAFRPEKLF